MKMQRHFHPCLPIVIVLIFYLSTPCIAETYIVTNTKDSGPGSFRQAITNANNHPGLDIIEFNIPISDKNYKSDTGVWTIQPLTQLPSIIDNDLIIEGGSQSAYIGSDTNPVGPEIELDGSLTSYTDCFYITANEIEIFELVINRFYRGIFMTGVEGGMISGCYIGTDVTGMSKASNSIGITLHSQSRHISINPREDKPSIISGNTNVGITVSDTSNQNIIIGNIIGLNRIREDTLGNGSIFKRGGINIEDRSDSNQVIQNIICGNRYAGITIWHSSENYIGQNYIGTNEDWSISPGNANYGVWIRSDLQNPEETYENLVIENVIGYSGFYGVVVEQTGAYYNRITRNSISQNGSIGIYLSEGNMNLSAPTITSATVTEITGQAGPSQTIELFCDEEDEGMVFLGDTLSDTSGNFTFLLSSAPPLPNITATATDMNGNTSMFSTSVVTGIETIHRNLIPRAPYLAQNYPNPFNPVTTIRFDISKRSMVKLQIYDILGKKVETLVNEYRDGGRYVVEWNAAKYASGIYLYRLEAGDYVETRKLILQK